ncbi:M42 family metallopeptidase [Lentibacillus sp. Marseille-P4043]|uniref:M42 family metallopeptidase n=1 Tax=Lentibacillus sp. Marseille-P4043 TaxID=2040293 RepID=UPI000D0BE7DF|nr:M42 family metallopeptidase [Lentibacillus sp. Marseille-P4043]
MDLLRELTQAQSASGYENEVRQIMQQELEQISNDILYDHTGSIYGKREGNPSGPSIMLAGHMDEVAFMVKGINQNGYLRFTPLGGWWDQVMLAQRVSVITKKKKFTGVIGSKPPHLLQPEERKKVFPMREMYIDIGAHSKEQVEKWGIRVGDPIVPICPYEMMHDNDTVLSKALDNRIGCYMAVEAAKQLSRTDHPNTVYAGANVQEEVGLRGAETSPYAVEPDVAIVLDVGVAQDTPGTSSDDVDHPELRKGPLVTFLDASMIPNIRFRDLVVNTAEKNNIPYQIEVMTGGGTDAGKIHMYKQGVPTIVIGVPIRYMHSHVSLASKQDIENGVKLLVEVIKQLNSDTYASLINYK